MSKNTKGPTVSGCLSLFIIICLISVVVSAVQGVLDSVGSFLDKIPGFLNNTANTISNLFSNVATSGLLFVFLLPALLYAIYRIIKSIKNSRNKKASESLLIEPDEYVYHINTQSSQNAVKKQISIPHIHLFKTIIVDNNPSHYSDAAEARARDLLLLANDNYVSAVKSIDLLDFFHFYEDALFCLSQAAYIEQKNPSLFTNIQGNITEVYDKLQNGENSQIKLALNRLYDAIMSDSTYNNEFQSLNKRKLYSSLKAALESNMPKFDEDSVSFANYILSILAKDTNISPVRFNYNTDSLKIQNFDNLSGLEFENFCKKLLYNNGFSDVEGTKTSGDQGVDIIAQKDGLHYAIQCKCYSSKLGNTPIQEVCAGKTFYNCQIGVVMTNNYFTKSAQELSQATGTLLWDRNKLIEMSKNM